jgi:hypothetical protein
MDWRLRRIFPESNSNDVLPEKLPGGLELDEDQPSEKLWLSVE